VERHCAVVSMTSEHAVAVEQRGQILGMNAVDQKADNGTAMFRGRSEDPQSGDLTKPLEQQPGQLLFMLMYGAEPQLLVPASNFAGGRDQTERSTVTSEIM